MNDLKIVPKGISWKILDVNFFLKFLDYLPLIYCIGDSDTKPLPLGPKLSRILSKYALEDFRCLIAIFVSKISTLGNKKLWYARQFKHFLFLSTSSDSNCVASNDRSSHFGDFFPDELLWFLDPGCDGSSHSGDLLGKKKFTRN